ncbi:hypothetical protein NHQ30_006534 [Ciborinia camelliae]|nr:hypothetical protein NHQ30_006534 [Ciborinia camelliae]
MTSSPSPSPYPNAPSSSYTPHRNSQSYSGLDTNAPPPPPPKPHSRDVSRQGTPAGSGNPSFSRPGEPSTSSTETPIQCEDESHDDPEQVQSNLSLEDPGDQWLPDLLLGKSKQDLASILSNPTLLAALTHSKRTSHPSISASHEPIQTTINDNLTLATHLDKVASRLQHLRAAIQTQLLATHALERQWKQKQAEMDRALAPFAPSSLYQQLAQGVAEQEMICRAMEESFLEAQDVLGERDVLDWVRRFRDSKGVFYRRREWKDRWDEGRVGGWR